MSGNPKVSQKMGGDALPNLQNQHYGEDARRCDDIVSKNNQNTMLLDKLFEAEIQDGTHNIHSHKMIGFQSESRIFFFDCGQDGELQDAELENRKEKCRNLLLNLYVAPLVRIMRIGSTFFTVLDNASYACILLMFFGSSILTPEDITDMKHFFDMFNNDTTMNTITGVILGSDLTHNIMHSQTRLWNLSRMDLPLVLVIYSIYCILLSVGKSRWVGWFVLGFRFFSFYMAECCEYWVDIWVERIILSLREGNISAGADRNRGGADFTLPISNCCCNCVQKLGSKMGFPYSRLSSDDIEALSLYKGTFCSWNWKKSSVNFVRKYHLPGCLQQIPSNWNHLLFYPGGIIALITVLILSFVVAVFGLIALLFGYLVFWMFGGLEMYEEFLLW